MKVMSGSFPMIRVNFLFIIVAAVLVPALSGCGNEDPIVEATGDAPVPESFSIAYLKRPSDLFYTTPLVPNDPDPDPDAGTIDARQAAGFPPAFDDPDNPTVGINAGNVFIRDLSDPNNQEVNITDSITAPILLDDSVTPEDDRKSAGDVSDLEVSYDGTKLVFAMHEGVLEDPMAEENRWHIWIYDLNAPDGVDPLRELTDYDNDPSGYPENDPSNYIDPHFLPDGRIVFSSDRRDRSRSMNLDLYGDEYITVTERDGINNGIGAYALHVMNADGSGVKQISFNQSHDFDPSVLNNGKIVFTRWDGVRNNRSELSLYTVNPDGTEMEVLYGAHGHNFTDTQNNNTVRLQYTGVQPMPVRPLSDDTLPPGDLIGMLMPFTETRGGGEMILIDYANFIEPDVKRFTSPTLSTAGHVSATNNEVNQFGGTSLAGRYTTPFPIWEPGSLDRVLVSWDPCRVTDDLASEITEICKGSNTNNPAYELADQIYSIWIYEVNTGVKKNVVSPEPGMAIVNPVALVNRPLNQRPPVIEDHTFEIGKDDPELIDLESRGLGVINIKSVYDTEGSLPMVDRPLEPRGVTNLTTAERNSIPMTTVNMDRTTGAIAAPAATNVVSRTVADISVIRDPAQTTGDQRLARFLRISKVVPRPDLGNNSPLTGDDFGRNAGYGMREILGYAVIEPDGSAYAEVPADVPFTLEILDSKGRSLTANTHTNWLQLKRGEVRVCNGCHSPRDGQQSMNPGAPTDGYSAFPNTANTISAIQGETMAETRARLDYTYRQLKRDIIYDDVWTDPAVRTPDASFAYSYNDLITPSPVSNTGACDDVNWPWDGAFCRIAINFPDHIQPILDAKCIACHNDNDPDVVPPGNLVLETQLDIPLLQAYRDARTDTDRLASYEFLFIGRPQMEPVVGGGLRFVVVRDAADQPIDVDGNVIAEADIENLQYINPRPSLVSAGVARARFSQLIQVLTGDQLRAGTIIPTPTMDHTTLLTPGELRLIIEWNDNGTQNYNGLNAALIN